jgi:1-acyl-sn-glycerol-3-phosphate acyltransferase
MALDSATPIVPIVIRGTWPSMAKSSLRINPGSAAMEIGKPIATTGYTRQNKEDLIEHVRNVICEGFEKGIVN